MPLTISILFVYASSPFQATLWGCTILETKDHGLNFGLARKDNTDSTVLNVIASTYFNKLMVAELSSLLF